MHHPVALINTLTQHFHRCIQIDVQMRSKHLTKRVVSTFCVILLNCTHNNNTNYTNYTMSRKNVPLWLAITLTHVNRF